MQTLSGFRYSSSDESLQKKTHPLKWVFLIVNSSVSMFPLNLQLTPTHF